jgi:hypothetical protein
MVSPNRRVALGHTRLSIIDLETGDQPITNESGRIFKRTLLGLFWRTFFSEQYKLLTRMKKNGGNHPAL